jgi:hypothetical protein
MDKRAIDILFKTYWSSTGWKPEKDQITPPGDLDYAKRAGVMFDPIRLSHDDIVRRAIEVCSRIDLQAVAGAFLASLSTRRLDLRSAAGSFSVLRHFPEHEHRNRRSQCPICGGDDSPDDDEDLNALNFERLKWGGVRHEDPIYATFDLEWFVTLDMLPPTDADVAILQDLVRGIEAVPAQTTASQLQGKLGSFLPSNKAEREILINILGYMGILNVPERPGFRDALVPYKRRQLPPQRFVDLGYPACWWRGRYGLDREALRSWYPTMGF